MPDGHESPAPLNPESRELNALVAGLFAAAARDGQRNDTRTRILRTAIEMFASEGFAATTVRSLAAEVGITGGAVYSHFASKEAILAAALANTYAGFLSEVLEVDDFALPAAERLERRLRRHMRFQLGRRPLAAASDSLFSNPSVMALVPPDVRRLLEASRRFYFEAVQRDVVRVSPPSSGLFHELQTRSLLSLGDSIYRVPGIVDGSVSAESVIDSYLAIMKSIIDGPR